MQQTRSAAVPSRPDIQPRTLAHDLAPLDALGIGHRNRRVEDDGRVLRLEFERDRLGDVLSVAAVALLRAYWRYAVRFYGSASS